MPRIGDIKQSRFLTQSEVDPPVLVTIAGFEEIDVARPGAEPEMRWCIEFRELDKPMTLNTTNAAILGSIFGLGETDDLDQTKGAQIVLYRDPNISFGGKIVGGIRIRAVKSDYQQPQQPPVEDSPSPPNDDDVPF